MFNWIFLGFFSICIISFILGFILKKSVIEKIASCLIMPATGALAVSFLVKYLPDSLNIITFTSLAFVMVIFTELFLIFDSRKSVFALEMIFIYLSCGSWGYLHHTIFYLYHVSQIIPVIAGIVYLCIFITCLIFTGKQKIHVYGLYSISALVVSILHYCSFVTLCFEKNMYSLFLFSGVTIFLGFVYFTMLDRYKFKFKYGQTCKTALLLISEILISLSSILMIR